MQTMPGRPRLPLLLPIPGAPDSTRAVPDAGALVADLLVAPSGTCPAASGVYRVYVYALARLTRRACAGVARDAHSEVGLTLDTLRHLQLLSGTHVLVTSCGSGISRLARVVALEPGGIWQEGAQPLARSRRPAVLLSRCSPAPQASRTWRRSSRLTCSWRCTCASTWALRRRR